MKNNAEQDAQYVARRDADATREKLAEIYATALIGACGSMGVDARETIKEYDSFVESVCDAFPKLEEILNSVAVPIDEKLRIVDELCVGTSTVFRNFLKTLAKRGRFELLRLARDASRRIDDERRGVVSVKVVAAAPLEQATLDDLTASLTKLVGGIPKFSVEIEPNMIGGIVVRVGDVVYDASIATQLKKARQEMIDRSAHEIQSRRDCFSYPEGN